MTKVIQVADFCRCLNVPYRDVRYVLERGFVPQGVAKHPATGNHRRFSAQQAFWLAHVVLVKLAGVKTPLAAQIADYALETLKNTTQAGAWDPDFHPGQGRFRTDHQYYVDIGDSKYLRFVTSANPSRRGLTESPWLPVNGPVVGKSIQKSPRATITPAVILRIDQAAVARLLDQAKWEAAD